MQRKLAPGGLLRCWLYGRPAGRLENRYSRWQSHVVEDLDDYVVSQDHGDYLPLPSALGAYLRVYAVDIPYRLPGAYELECDLNNLSDRFRHSPECGGFRPPFTAVFRAEVASTFFTLCLTLLALALWIDPIRKK